MKCSLRISLLLAGVCAVLPVTGLLAQEPVPGATPSVSAPAGTGQPGTSEAPGAGKGHARMRAALAALSPEERQELKTARKQAMQDPAVQEAKKNRETDRKGYHRAMQAAMLKADPNIKPILEKMHSGMKRKDFQTS